jgi:hypothetical protein
MTMKNHKPKKSKGAAAVAWSALLVLKCISVWRRPQPPALCEFYGCTLQEAKDSDAKLLKAMAALGKTTNCITICCGTGIAEIADTSNPVGRVICIINHIRPRHGKVTAAREFQKFIEQTELYEQRLSVRIVKKLTDLMRRMCKRNHRTNGQAQAQPPERGVEGKDDDEKS